MLITAPGAVPSFILSLEATQSEHLSFYDKTYHSEVGTAALTPELSHVKCAPAANS